MNDVKVGNMSQMNNTSSEIMFRELKLGQALTLK